MRRGCAIERAQAGFHRNKNKGPTGGNMPSFDAIASQTVRVADHLEPAFRHETDIADAVQKLTGRKKKPNILIYLMDDVGWGDFGCYGGGVAVGAPTPNFDRLARAGLQLTSCYSEPTCSPSRATLLTGRVPDRKSTRLNSSHRL